MKTLIIEINCDDVVGEFEVEYSVEAKRCLFGTDVDGNSGVIRVEHEIYVHRMIDEHDQVIDHTDYIKEIEEAIMKEY